MCYKAIILLDELGASLLIDHQSSHIQDTRMKPLIILLDVIISV